MRFLFLEFLLILTKTHDGCCRFGWFIQKNLSSSTEDSIHWKTFQSPETAKAFHNEELTAQMRKLSVDPETGHSYCHGHERCIDGMYVPLRCTDRVRHGSCAVLFAGHFGESITIILFALKKDPRVGIFDKIS